MYRAIIIGASSGIGYALAKQLLLYGVKIGVAARRTDRLQPLVEKYGVERVVVKYMDVTSNDATTALHELIGEIGAPDLLLYASGIGKQNPELDEDIEINTVRTNCEGMVRIVDSFINYVKRESLYTKSHKAHIAVISSMAGTMGMGSAPAYSATKSMQSCYLTALSQYFRMYDVNCTVSDIRPGFVATDILNPEKHYPMLMSREVAVKHILRGLKHHRRVIIFDWRFRLLYLLWRIIPRVLWERMTIVKN